MNTAATAGQIVALCRGHAAPLLIRHEHDPQTLYSEMSAIKKSSVSTLHDPKPIFCHRLGLEGDEQADQSVHGGPSQALYCYPIEHYEFWRDQLAMPAQHAQPFGLVGENLCSVGLIESEVWIGDRWQIGQAELCVTAPRVPCHKFNARMSLKTAAKLMVKTGRCGWYLSVLKEGLIRAGDHVQVFPGSREVSITQQNKLLARR